MNFCVFDSSRVIKEMYTFHDRWFIYWPAFSVSRLHISSMIFGVLFVSNIASCTNRKIMAVDLELLVKPVKKYPGSNLRMSVNLFGAESGIFRANLVNTFVADAPAPSVARVSPAMVLIIGVRQVIALKKIHFKCVISVMKIKWKISEMYF